MDREYDIAKSIKHCYLHIPSGELYITRHEDITLRDFTWTLRRDTIYEEWLEVPLPNVEVINQMRLSQVIGRL